MSGIVAVAEGVTQRLALNEFRQSTQYELLVDGCINYHSGDSQIISVTSKQEIETLLHILGGEATVVMDSAAREKKTVIWDWLYGRTMDDILKELKWSYKEGEELQRLIERIPIPENVVARLTDTNNRPQKIDQRYVHKFNEDNVLISKPYQYGNMFYFEGFTSSNEFIVDHPSDHMEGIVIFEAVRQSGIASIHLSGVPFSGRIILLNAVTKYLKFVEVNKPYLIRTIPVVKLKGGSCYIVFEMLQEGCRCVYGQFDGFYFKSVAVYEKFRSSKLSG